MRYSLNQYRIDLDIAGIPFRPNVHIQYTDEELECIISEWGLEWKYEILMNCYLQFSNTSVISSNEDGRT